MKTRSLILATILAIPSTLAITIESALAQTIFQRPIGRLYFLPASPSVAPVSRADSNDDSIIDLAIIQFPKPRFEFSILAELNDQPIIDRDSRSNIGFFPNAIPSFLYVEDKEETSTRIKDDQGNFLPSSQEQETIQQIIPGVPNTFFDGDLRVERTNNTVARPGIIYEFNFGEDFIQFLLSEDSITDINSFLAVNDISYIVNQNLFGQESFVNDLFITDASFRVNGFGFKENELKSSIIFASQSVPEASNKISLLALGLISIRLLTKYKVQKS